MEIATSEIPKSETLYKKQKNAGQNVLAFQKYFGVRNRPMVYYKRRLR
jgi:hypothetical protein